MFVFLKLSKPLNAGFKAPLHAHNHRKQGDNSKTAALSGVTGTKKMARFEMLESGIGSAAKADILFELGLMYATGRDCDADVVAAHKWFNIAAIKGSDRAVQLRTELASTMSKAELAKALRDARQWMTAH